MTLELNFFIMSFTNIHTNESPYFHQIVSQAQTDFWVFWHESTRNVSVLMDSRDFYSIPRNQLKAAAMEVIPNPDYDTVVKCTKYSNVLYDEDTQEVDAIKETKDDDSEEDVESQIKCRVYEVLVKGHRGSRAPSPNKKPRVKSDRKNGRTISHSSSNGQTSTSDKRQKSTGSSGSTREKGKKQKSNQTQNFFYGGASF